MPKVVDPVTGVHLYELSHPWGYNIPMHPSFDDVKLERISRHARHGVMTQKFTTVFHASTHVNAPLHLVPGAQGVGQIPMDRFFGTGVVLDIPKGKWELVTGEDLENASPGILPQDIVIIATGWYGRYSDSKEYFGYSPGLAKSAADWLIARGVKLVGVDTGDIDHPCATSLVNHREGPQVKYLMSEYKTETGREPKADFPEWRPAHRALLKAGIPTIECVGGDIAEVLGRRCTFQCFPWNWWEGDACVVRLVAMFDSTGKVRLEAGKA
ncbi:MAG: cyclase family protein [Burkholderiales bacterium]|nr:cyclase family protein [Burkholderiales bacterium]